MKIFKWFCWHDWFMEDNILDSVSHTFYIIKKCKKCNKETGFISDCHTEYDCNLEYVKETIAMLRRSREA